MLGTTEILLIGTLALLIFGGKKVPELMRGLGQGVKEFKNGMKDTEESTSNINNEDVKSDENIQENIPENIPEEKQ